MEQFSLIIIVFTAITANSNAYQWIMNQYPELTDDYSQHLINSQNEVLHLSLVRIDNMQTREALCTEVGKSIQFQLNDSPLGQNVLIPATEMYYNTIISEIQLFYRGRPLPTTLQSVRTVQAGEDVLFLYTITCSINRELGVVWFLAPGFDENSLLVLSLRNEGGRQKTTVVGLAESSATVDQVNPEPLFLLHFNETLGSERSRSVCSLSPTQKFRLCASTFPGYMRSKNAEIAYVVNYIRSNPVCIVDAEISFRVLYRIHTHTYASVKADLLMCVLNVIPPFHQSTFYVTADPQISDAVFVVESRPVEGDASSSPQSTRLDVTVHQQVGPRVFPRAGSPRNYDLQRMNLSPYPNNFFLFMHLTGVAVLRSL